MLEVNELNVDQLIDKIREQLDYNIKNYKKRMKVTEEIYNLYGEHFNQLYAHYCTSNLDDYSNYNMYLKLHNTMDLINNYVLFAPESPDRDGLKISREEDLKEQTKINSVSLEGMVQEYMKHDEQIEEDGNDKSIGKKHYDDYNSGRYELKNLAEDIKKCPQTTIVYMVDDIVVDIETKNIIDCYKDFNKNARWVIENNELNKDDVYILKKSIGYKPNNSVEIDKDIIAVLRDCIKHIYFKNPLNETSDYHYDWFFDIEDKDTVLSLIRMGKRANLQTDRGCLVYDFQNVFKKVHLNDLEREVIKLLKENSTQQEIANKLGITQRYISDVINNIYNKTVNKYWKEMEDWYYTYIVKGTYKQCSQCKKNKLATERYFGKDERNKDNFKSYCKKCDKKGKLKAKLHENHL